MIDIKPVAPSPNLQPTDISQSKADIHTIYPWHKTKDNMVPKSSNN